MRRIVLMRDHRTDVFSGLVSKPCLLCDVFWYYKHYVMKCVYYGTGEVRKGAQVQCGHVYIVKKKKAGCRHFTHSALSHFLFFLHCCSFVFKSFRQCCSSTVDMWSTPSHLVMRVAEKKTTSLAERDINSYLKDDKTKLRSFGCV